MSEPRFVDFPLRLSQPSFDSPPVAENACNLNIPRYVDTFEEEEEVDIAAVQERIHGIECELDF